VWYRYAQFVSDKSEDWYVKRIMNIMYGKDWRNLPNNYDLFTDVVDNLDKYKSDYREILLQNILPKKPLVEVPPEEPTVEEPSIEEPSEEPPGNEQIQPYNPPEIHNPISLDIHENCRCQLVWMNNRYIWVHHEDCCDECARLADQYNNVKAKNNDFPISKQLNFPILIS
jgi:hypothetical protein